MEWLLWTLLIDWLPNNSCCKQFHCVCFICPNMYEIFNTYWHWFYGWHFIQIKSFLKKINTKIVKYNIWFLEKASNRKTSLSTPETVLAIPPPLSPHPHPPFFSSKSWNSSTFVYYISMQTIWSKMLMIVTAVPVKWIQNINIPLKGLYWRMSCFV